MAQETFIKYYYCNKQILLDLKSFYQHKNENVYHRFVLWKQLEKKPLQITNPL